MPAYILYYIPAAVFTGWGVFGVWKFPDWRTARYVKSPERQIWTISRLLNDDEWTVEGILLRRAYLKHVAIGLLLAAIAGLFVAVVSGRVSSR